MKARKILVKGILFNRFHAGDLMEEDNREMCELMAGVPVLACIAENDRNLMFDADALAALYE